MEGETVPKQNDWERAGAVIRGRMGVLLMTQADLVRASGVSDATVRSLMHGTPRATPTPITLGKVSRALGWTDESIALIVSGGDPVLADPNESTPSTEPTPQSTQQAEMMEALRDLVDSLVARVDESVADLDRVELRLDQIDRRLAERSEMYELLERRVAGLEAGKKPASDTKPARPRR